MSWKPKRSVRLYLDDIDDLLGIAKDLDPAATARTKEWDGITDASEMQGWGPSDTADFQISAGDPDSVFKVDTERGGIAVWISSRDSMELKGALTEASSVLTGCERKLLGAWANRLPPYGGNPIPLLVGSLLSVIATAIIVALAGYSQEERPEWQFPLLAGLVVLVVAGWTVFGKSDDPSAKIVTSRRADAPSWWLRNRTNVLISLASNVLVAIVFYFLGSAARS